MISDPSKIDEVRFWGRIRGTKSNYYIAISTRFVGEYESPSKAFFYSTNDFKFKRLPFVVWSLKDWVNSIEHDDFTGKPDKIIFRMKSNDESEKSSKDLNDGEVLEENPVEDNTGEEEIELVNSKSTKMIKKKEVIVELERLAFVVRAIENECAAVPVGAVKIMPNHQLR